MNTKLEKTTQLGMNPGTAMNKLLKDIIFDNIEDKNCYHCKEPMLRDNFSIEHKKPWLHSDNAKELFFDLNNISYSHLTCNIKNGRRWVKKPCTHGSHRMYDQNKCRCDICRKFKSDYRKKNKR